MTDTNIITVDQFKQFAPEVDLTKYNDPTVSGFISNGSRMASDYLYYTPLAEVIVDEVKQGIVTNEGDLLIFPNKVPIISLSSVNIFRGATTVALGLTSGGVNKYNIDYTNRNIRIPYQEMLLQGTPVFTDFYSLRGVQFYTKISYEGGWTYDNMPPSITQAVVFLVKDLMSGQYNQMGVSRMSQGSLSFAYSGKDGGKSKLLQDAYRLLNPYRRVG